MSWVAEGAFSIFKRIFGEHVMSLKWERPCLRICDKKIIRRILSHLP